MGKIDAITYEYMSDNTRFADVFNYYLYDGRRVIQADKLHELDSRELIMPYGNDGAKETIQRFRDLMKYSCAMEDDNAAYLLLGIENQSNKHFAMPVRNMVYDAAQYAKQVSNAAASRRGNKKTGREEYLSGFTKEDKLLPVITLVIFWSSDKWDAPTSIYEMIDIKDEDVLKYIQNYRINLIAPYDMKEEDFTKFDTSIAKALKYIKYSKDGYALHSMLRSDKAYERVDLATAEVIRAVTNSSLKFEENGGEVVNMCLAEEQIIEMAKNESKQEIAKKFIEMGKVSLEDIAFAVGLKLEEVEALAGE